MSTAPRRPPGQEVPRRMTWPRLDGGTSSRAGRLAVGEGPRAVSAACRGQRRAWEETASGEGGCVWATLGHTRLSQHDRPARRALPLRASGLRGTLSGRGRGGTRQPLGSWDPGRPASFPVRSERRDPREAPPRGQSASGRLRLPRLPTRGISRPFCRQDFHRARGEL
ncbi:uncharacterized protein WM277_004249 isoform 2-T2 [Molossus nigricans]